MSLTSEENRVLARVIADAWEPGDNVDEDDIVATLLCRFADAMNSMSPFTAPEVTCALAGCHLDDCDGDGYCNSCGHQ